MTAEEILQAMSEDVHLIHQVMMGLGAGMLDEWDCSIPYGMENGFSAPEFSLAAKAGASWLRAMQESGVDLTYKDHNE